MVPQKIAGHWELGELWHGPSDHVTCLVPLRSISCHLACVCLTGPKPLRPVPSPSGPLEPCIFQPPSLFLGSSAATSCSLKGWWQQKMQCISHFWVFSWKQLSWKWLSWELPLCLFLQQCQEPHGSHRSVCEGEVLADGVSLAKGALCRCSQRRDGDGESQFPVKLAWLFL